MKERMNTVKLRGILLGFIILLSFNMTGCAIFKAIFGQPSVAAVEMEATMEATMETTMEAEEEMPMAEPEVAPEPLMVSDDIYVVAKGESLWSISGMSSIYNDPFRWPLIYARNKNIEDADLIHPGQELSIRRDLSRAEIDASVMHAKNRGAWSIGEAEESDTAFRGSMM